MQFDSGFQTDILNILEKRVGTKMKEQEKVCVLLVDEISLKEGLSYDEKKDRVDGLEDFGVLGRTKTNCKSGFSFYGEGIIDKLETTVSIIFLQGIQHLVITYQFLLGSV